MFLCRGFPDSGINGSQAADPREGGLESAWLGVIQFLFLVIMGKSGIKRYKSDSAPFNKSKLKILDARSVNPCFSLE